MKLDDFDHQMLECLSQSSARISNRKIATKLGVTEGTIRNRLKKLRKNKAIQIRAVTNATELGAPPVVAYIGIDVDRNMIHEVSKKIVELEEIRFAATLLGRFDILAIALAPSIEKISTIVDGKIARIPGVQYTETTLSLKHIKYDYRWGRIVD